MGEIDGFLKYERLTLEERSVQERVQDYREITLPYTNATLTTQAARCMDCGVPFCHASCPLHNLIPEWNHLVYKGKHLQALKRLLATNNFPEITGRVCPAPCEAACVLNIPEQPVSIKAIEHTLADQAYAAGLTPELPLRKTSKRVAIVGSGPAGLAAAQDLARLGHTVVVFERDRLPGGLLRYGIPNFKLAKHLLDIRLQQMTAEGVIFSPATTVGVNFASHRLLQDFNAIILAGGAKKPRDLHIPGRELLGIHFAMEYLTAQNKRLEEKEPQETKPPTDLSHLDARGLNVVVIGGGDTGADCVGTARRQGAKSITQIELLDEPPLKRLEANPWPEWPKTLRTSSSHAEGCTRLWSTLSKSFISSQETETLNNPLGVHPDSPWVVAIAAVKVTFKQGQLEEIPHTQFRLPADLVLLALGFTGPEPTGLLQDLEIQLDARGNVATDTTGRTNRPQIFAAGDMARGQSLVVTAIADGKRVAQHVHEYLSSC